MDISELRQGAGHGCVSRAKTPFLVHQFLVQLQFVSSEDLLQMQRSLDLGKKCLHTCNKCIGVICTQAAGLEYSQGALS
eukprot:846454-Amphidinium_carterae.1